MPIIDILLQVGPLILLRSSTVHSSTNRLTILIAIFPQVFDHQTTTSGTSTLLLLYVFHFLRFPSAYLVAVTSPPAVVLKLIQDASSALMIPSQKAGPIPDMSISMTSACIRGSFNICNASGSGDEYPMMVGPNTCKYGGDRIEIRGGRGGTCREKAYNKGATNR